MYYHFNRLTIIVFASILSISCQSTVPIKPSVNVSKKESAELIQARDLKAANQLGDLYALKKYLKKTPNGKHNQTTKRKFFEKSLFRARSEINLSYLDDYLEIYPEEEEKIYNIKYQLKEELNKSSGSKSYKIKDATRKGRYYQLTTQRFIDNDGEKLTIYDFYGNQLSQITFPQQGKRKRRYYLSRSYDDQHIVAAIKYAEKGGANIFVYDIVTSKLVFKTFSKFHKCSKGNLDRVNGCFLNRNGQDLIVVNQAGGGDRRVSSYNITTGEKAWSTIVEYSRNPKERCNFNSLDISFDGKFLVSSDNKCGIHLPTRVLTKRKEGFNTGNETFGFSEANTIETHNGRFEAGYLKPIYVKDPTYISISEKSDIRSKLTSYALNSQDIEKIEINLNRYPRYKTALQKSLLISLYRDIDSFEGFSKAFLLSKDPMDYRSLLSKANNEDEKYRSEKQLLSVLRDKVFSITRIGSSTNNLKTQSAGLFSLSAASVSGKTISQDFKLTVKKNLNFSHSVKVKFILNLEYDVQNILYSKTESVTKEKYLTFRLSKSKNFDLKTIKFEDVVAAVDASAFGINGYRAKLKKVGIEYEIISII